MAGKPTTIAAYIQAAPAEHQARLRSLHQCILAAAPDATEGLKWGMPAYSHDKILVTFALFKNHIGFYPMESAIQAFEKELSAYTTSQGGIRFPHDKALPLPLIRKLVKFRVKESRDGSIRWRS